MKPQPFRPFAARIPVLMMTLALVGFPLAAADNTDTLKTATFAGGCFWCMEGPFDEIDGVVSTTSGYTGGHAKNPTYRQVTSGRTGHTEAIQVVYDSSKVDYDQLLEVYWVNVDPLRKDAQFCDRGSQYRSGIFYHDEAQKSAALATRMRVQDKFAGQTVHTEVTPIAEFYPAEEYHQDYYMKNPFRYKYYVTRCGRYARLKELWGDASKH